jgi:hypothetical protein
VVTFSYFCLNISTRKDTKDEGWFKKNAAGKKKLEFFKFLVPSSFLINLVLKQCDTYKVISVGSRVNICTVHQISQNFLMFLFSKHRDQKRAPEEKNHRDGWTDFFMEDIVLGVNKAFRDTFVSRRSTGGKSSRLPAGHNGTRRRTHCAK